MPGKKLLLLFYILYSVFCILSPSHIYAVDPTPTPDRSTCDRCGWCGRFITPGPDITPHPSPFNWDKCNTCLYPTPSGPVNEKRYYTLIGCVDTEAGPFVQKILGIVFGIAGGLAFMSVLYGSATVLMSKGDPENIQNGKEIITSSLIGILLIVFSVFLLKIVGVDILKLPGMG
jgi:hypothetical protein